MKTEDVQAALFSQSLKDGSDLVRQLMTLSVGVCAAMFTLVDRAHRAECGVWLWGFSEGSFALSVVCCYRTMLLDKAMISNELGLVKSKTDEGIKAAHRLSGKIIRSEWASMGLFVFGGVLAGCYAIVTRELR